MAGETWEGWTRKFLTALGAPATKENLCAIYSVIAAEGTSINWNPLAVTGAGTPGNSVGVGNFTDEVTGIAATVNFLNAKGPQDYPGRIVTPLQGGNGLQALHGMDATGAWQGDFPGAYNRYNTYLNASDLAGAYGSSPLLADPGHGQGDPGAASGKLGDVTGIKPLNTIDDVFSALSSIATFFGDLTKKATWVRIGEILGGTILVFLAVNLARNDIYPRFNSAKGIAGTVKKVAEAAAIG